MTEDFVLRGLSSQKAYDYENGFAWFASPKRLAMMIAQYELYKKCVTVPGDILEFGVFKGTSLVRLAIYRDITEFSAGRKIYAFDTFDIFPTDNISSKEDRDFIAKFTNEAQSPLTEEELQKILALKGFSNICFVKGNIMNSLVPFLDNNPQLRFSLINIDVDVYEPTAFILKHIYPRLSKNGIIMCDDYNVVQGATRAFDEFVAGKPKLTIKVLPCSTKPAYIQNICCE